MSFLLFNRRDTLKLGASALLAINGPARADRQAVHFVPAGRIGFAVPEGVGTWNETWRLLSADHAFSVDIYEQLRLGPSGDDYIWEKDDRSRRVQPSIERQGFELREFYDLRYGDSKDYSSRSIVLRDATWMGQVEISTQNLGSPLSPAEGQIARWNDRANAVFASITVREQPPIEQALAEVGIRLDAPHLHPRITGKTLILSLSAPRTNLEAWAANGPSIRSATLMVFVAGQTDKESEQLVRDQFDINKGMIEQRGLVPEVLEGPHVRGLLSAELEFIPGQFSTTLSLYGRSRFLDLQAYYDVKTRDPILAALRGIVDRIEFRSPV